ncbi:MAG: AAA family ATPase [Candidatus Omnitrophota bacterium]
MKKIKSVYISSIYQNAGKTTISLGLYQIFRERKLKPVFLKPVGQQTVDIDGLDIDKDSYLLASVYRCKSVKEMSPVTIGRGYTEKYIISPNPQELHQKILQAHEKLKLRRDSIIIEGTGHAGVGSVVDVSNADVARLLESKVIIVSEGGIGKCIDEVMLNKALFDIKGVEVLGVIVNKVLPEKYERIKGVLTLGFKQKGLKLLGCIPKDPLLSDPTVEQVQQKMKLQLLSGKRSNMHKRVCNTIVAAMEPSNMVEHITDGTLVLASGDRVDNIMIAVTSHLIVQSRRKKVIGIILTGGLTPDEKILRLLRRSGIPVMVTSEETYKVAGKIDNLVCKIQRSDIEKIQEARSLVKKYVDVEEILKNL